MLPVESQPPFADGPRPPEHLFRATLSIPARRVRRSRSSRRRSRRSSPCPTPVL